MTFPSRTDAQQGVPARLYGSDFFADRHAQQQGDEEITIPISRIQFDDGRNAQPGDIGVVVCILPVDISLRAYVIDAIGGVAAEHGFVVINRREVPVCAELLGDAAFTRPPLAQFLIGRPMGMAIATFEHNLASLQSAIESELAGLGMTSEDVRIVSCSAQTVTYPGLDGYNDLEALYPDLKDVQQTDLRQVKFA